jgi:thiol-disulfide isomerase/thioredoxin
MKTISSVPIALLVGFVVGISLTMAVFYFVFPLQTTPSKVPLVLREDFQRVVSDLPSPDLEQSYPIYNSPWTLQSMDGSLVEPNAFKGKVLFVNVWAPWSQACVSELPTIDSLIRTTASSEVAFLLLTDENQDTVKDFLSRHEFSLPVYFYTQGSLPASLVTDHYPTTFVINKKGQVVLRQDRQANWNHPSVHEFLSMQVE